MRLVKKRVEEDIGSRSEKTSICPCDHHLECATSKICLSFICVVFLGAIIYYPTFLVTVYKTKENVTLLSASGDNGLRLHNQTPSFSFFFFLKKN